MTNTQKQSLLESLNYCIGVIKDSAEDTPVGENTATVGMDPSAVNVYSLTKEGSKYLTANFQVHEFACKDGSDPVFIHPKLPQWCQAVRDEFGYAFSPNSAYRTPSHNKAVSGAVGSFHTYGLAVDIPAKGDTTPQMLYDFFEELLGDSGELGIYSWGVHVAVQETKERFVG